MTPEMIILAALLFLPIAGISFFVLRRTWASQERVSERLQRPRLDYLPESSSDFLFEYLTVPLAGLLPATEQHRATLQQELRSAGFYRNSALSDYLALRNLLVLVPLVLACLLAVLLEPEEIPIVVVAGIVIAILGYSLPRLYIQVRGRNRARQIERGLPTAVDLLTLALTAGMNLQAALQRVAGELRFSYPVLAEEFDITRRQAELRSLEHSLSQLADRVRLPEVRNLAIIMAQSERQGSDAITVLLETSNTLRTTLRQRAEAHANRASFWMLFPTIGCFLVAAGLLLVTPVMLDVSREMTGNFELLQKSQKTMKNIRTPLKYVPGPGPQAPE